MIRLRSHHVLPFSVVLFPSFASRLNMFDGNRFFDCSRYFFVFGHPLYFSHMGKPSFYCVIESLLPLLSCRYHTYRVG